MSSLFLKLNCLFKKNINIYFICRVNEREKKGFSFQDKDMCLSHTEQALATLLLVSKKLCFLSFQRIKNGSHNIQ